MANGRSGTVRADWQPGVLTWAGWVLVLVPEAPLIATLVCVYLLLDSPPLLGLIIAALIISFIVRTAALHLARAALESARYREADALALVALTLYPWSADALALRGALALATGAPADAEQALVRAIRLLPGQPSFYAALSSALLELGRPVEAAEAARQALALNRRDALAHLYLAEAARALVASPHEVEDRLREGLTVAALPDAEATLRCALAAHLIGEHRMAEAALTLQGAEALLPRCQAARQVALRLRLGELLAALGQHERAQEHFRSVAALDPHGRYAAMACRAGRT